jgi:hypothetical protein
MNGKEALEFVSGYLMGENEDLRFEAAAALGQCTSLEAFQKLEQCHRQARLVRLREALLLAIGATRRPEAVEYLLDLINADDITSASQAIAALGPNLTRHEVMERTASAVRQTGSSTLEAALRKASTR